MAPFPSGTESCAEPIPIAFCSYCGQPPSGVWRERAHRVCRRCNLGIVLEAPVDAAPNHDDAFLIVDRRLLVQAISRRAEAALRIAEPEGVGVPMRNLLRSEPDPGAGALTDLVAVAASGGVPVGWLELSSVRDAKGRFLARVTSCGPPSAALFVLTPLPPHSAPSEPRPSGRASRQGAVAGPALGRGQAGAPRPQPAQQPAITR